MFNLEQAILEWRRQMLSAGIKSPVPLEELESHLREEVERQMRTGMEAERAFEFSVGQIGGAQRIKMEFTKIERNRMKRATYIILGILGVMIGMALVVPAMAWYRDHHTWPANVLADGLIGLLIVVSGVSSAIYGLKKRHA